MAMAELLRTTVRVTVGDPHAYSFLAAEHGPDLGLGGGLDQRSGRVGAQELGAFDLENAGDGIDDFHGRPPWALGMTGRPRERAVGQGPGVDYIAGARSIGTSKLLVFSQGLRRQCGRG